LHIDDAMISTHPSGPTEYRHLSSRNSLRAAPKVKPSGSGAAMICCAAAAHGDAPCSSWGEKEWGATMQMTENSHGMVNMSERITYELNSMTIILREQIGRVNSQLDQNQNEK
jgi:hypothetical protein